MELDDLKTRYSERALKDLISVFRDNEVAIFNVVALERMKALDTGPWRTFGGTGLTEALLASLLLPFRIVPKPVSMDRGSANKQPGYERAALEEGAQLPMEVWVAEIGHQPTIPRRARRIRDFTPKREHPVVRKLIESNGWSPWPSSFPRRRRTGSVRRTPS